MLARLRRNLTFANVASATALFVALSTGGAYAANTVFSTDIVDGEVKTPDLANLGVTNPKLGAASVTNAKLSSGSVTNAKLSSGSVTNGKLANNAVTSPKILDGQVITSDLANNVIDSAKVVDGSLNDEDIGQGTFSFDGSIGVVPANECVDREVSGVNARLDHALLTPDWNNADGDLFYSLLGSSQTGTIQGFVMIRVCNPTAVDQNDGITRFNLLVIDAQ